MFKKSSHLMIVSAVVPMLLLTACQSVDKKPQKKKEIDRFAFLRKDKNIKDKGENYESASAERIQPKDAERPVVEAEKLAKFNWDSPARTPIAELAKSAPKFYEDFIALNADEELEVSLVFNSAPLLDVLSAFGDLLGFNFVADSDLRGVVTLNLNSKMTRRELWNTFDRMVFLAGAGIKVEDSLLRIMALNKLAMQPDNRSGKGSKTEIYYRQLINATSTEVTRQIRGFLGAGAIIADLTRPNAVMVCDSAENMPKIRELIEYLDRNGKTDWPRAVIPCNHVLPTKVALELQEILPVLGLKIHKSSDRTDQPGAVYVVGLDRMRLMVISAATQEAVNLIREWVNLLDSAGSDDQESVFVYKVRHNKAAHLSRALSIIFETQGTALTIDSNTGNTRLETINSPTQRRISSTIRTTTPSSTVNAGTNMETDQNSKVFGQPVRVFADGVLNRLVIRCTPRTYASIKALLDKLDVVPAQVLLQVLMVEVTLTESTQFGLEFSGTATSGSTSSVFGTNYPNTNTGTYLSPFMTDKSGNSVLRTGADRQGGATFAITDPNDPQRRFGYIRAQAGNGLVKVISSPQLLVSSHTEASINVGQSVPYVSNSLTNASSSGNVSNSYTYKDVGVILKVTPYVTSTDLISLEISQTMSSAIPNTITNSDQPVFSQRTLETSMTIANGQTMVLGGLIQENTNDSLDSVPIINQIPILKRLIGSTNASVERTEVLVLITGYIVNEHSEIDTLIRRYNDAIKALHHYDKGLGDKPDAHKHRGVLFSNEEFWK
ncbi:MAG: hypothetical protein E7042_01185 [Lentisphaerae bacterium]|nr:hypothetical protein [Lentisphaerota bacterium]